VNTVMNLGLHKMLGRSGISIQLGASQEGFSCMKLVRLFNHLKFDARNGNYIVCLVYLKMFPGTRIMYVIGWMIREL
jgi:hypothetical protein